MVAWSVKLGRMWKIWWECFPPYRTHCYLPPYLLLEREREEQRGRGVAAKPRKEKRQTSLWTKHRFMTRTEEKWTSASSAG